MPELVPTAYHRAMHAALASAEPGLFAWYGSDDYEAKRADRLRLELLRTSYRLGVESHARPHRLARAAADALGVTVPIALYQLHQTEHANAGLCFARDAAHVVLSGPLLAALDDAELTALFGHELAHHALFTLDGGAHLVTAELLEAIASDARASTSFLESAMRNRRWTELFADRGAAIAAGGIDPAIACLVKVSTGLVEISVADYLEQAREVVARLDEAEPERGTHPETAIRAIALELWHQKGAEADAEIAVLVEGAVALETLDLVQQHREIARTREVIDRVLAPAWMRTDATLAHARAYFPGYEWTAARSEAAGALGELASYVLLDFAVVDRAHGEVALAHALAVAEALDVREAFVAVARKELKQTASALAKLAERGPALCEKAAEQHAAGGES